MSELFSFLKRGSSIKGLQLLKNPIAANWNTNSSTLANLGNNLSAWGVEYAPTGKTLPQAYINFLKNLKVTAKIDAATEKRIEELKNNIASFKKTIEDETVVCQERHARHERLRGKIDYSEYETKYCFRISSTRELLTVAEVQLSQTLSSVPGADVATAIDAFNDANDKFDWTESFVQKLTTFLNKIETGKADSFGIVVTKSSTSQKNVTQEWSWESLEKGKNNDFIPVSVSGSSSALTTSADNFKMEIEAKGYYAIEIGPGKWFDLSVVKKYANGPFIDAAKNTGNFGQGGLLSMLAQRAYLLYKPTVHLFLEQSDAQTIQGLTKSNPFIKLGPFVADAKTLTVTPVPSSTLYKVSLSSNDEVPQVVALDNMFL